MIKEKLLNNVIVCKELLKDIEEEVEEIVQGQRGHVSYFNCNKEKVSRSRLIILEKLLEVEKAFKENKQE